MSRKGENIYERKDGRWEGRYKKEKVNGRMKYGYVYAKSYSEVKEKLEKAVMELESSRADVSQDGMGNKSDFQSWAEAWMVFMRPRLKESSVVKYNNLLNTYLYPRIGEKNITEFTYADITNISSELLFSGGKGGRGLSPKTVICILSALKSVFEYAAQNGNYQIIHLKKISIRQPQKPMRIFSLTEQQLLNRELCGNLTLINLGILLCLYTGIRIGELCALTWEDIYLEEEVLFIHKTMQRLQMNGLPEQKTKILISEPKSDCSIRKIPLPDGMLRLLKNVCQPPEAFLLTGKSNRYIEPRTMQNHFRKVLKKCGIEYANFHALRHTFATRCIEVGFDIKSLSEILGHASVNITLNRYVHPSMELKHKNMNMLSGLLDVR